MKRQSFVKRIISLALGFVMALWLTVGFVEPILAIDSGSMQTIYMDGRNGAAITKDGSLWVWGTFDRVFEYVFSDIDPDTSHLLTYPTPVRIRGEVRSIVNPRLVILQDGGLWEFIPHREGIGGEWQKLLDDVREAGTDSGFNWAVRTDNSLWVWGRFFVDGQVIFDYETPTKLMDDVRSASVGLSFMVLRLDGSLWGMGSNRWGELGDGTTQARDEFVRIMDGVKDVLITRFGGGGFSYTMIIKEDGSLWATGNNVYAVLGDGTTSHFRFGGEITLDNNRHTPVKIMDGVRAVRSGGNLTFAITQSNALYGWGQNRHGALGGLTGELYRHPTRIMDNVADVSSNGENTLILLLDGTLLSMGQNSHGQIGDGTQDIIIGPPRQVLEDNTRLTPVRIMDNVMLPGASPITTPTQPTIPQQPTTDTPSSWAVTQVNAAIAAGLVPQNLQTRYTQPITRAEFTALAVALYETVSGREITARMTFNDTTDVNVQKMGALGVVTGVGDGNFAPNDTLTREQAAVMLARLSSVMERPLPPTHDRQSTFADNAQIAAWARPGVGQIQAAGIMGGVGDNQFAPNGDYTREQSIITMLRLFELLS